MVHPCNWILYSYKKESGCFKKYMLIWKDRSEVGSQDGKSDWSVVLPGVGLSGTVVSLGMPGVRRCGKGLGAGSHTPAGYLLSLYFSNLLWLWWKQGQGAEEGAVHLGWGAYQQDFSNLRRGEGWGPEGAILQMTRISGPFWIVRQMCCSKF